MCVCARACMPAGKHLYLQKYTSSANRHSNIYLYKRQLFTCNVCVHVHALVSTEI